MLAEHEPITKDWTDRLVPAICKLREMQETNAIRRGLDASQAQPRREFVIAEFRWKFFVCDTPKQMS
jgi:hypothetical protein